MTRTVETDPNALLIGLDIGGTKSAALVVDRALAVRGKALAPTDVNGPEALVAGVVRTVRRALDQAGGSTAPAAVLSAGIPGQVDPQSGVVRMAVNLNLEAYALRDALAAALGLPVLLENDMRLAAVGAHAYFQAHDPVDSLAYVGIGTGISAGVVLQGKLYRGAHGMAGEIGHTVVDPDGERCNCGQRGCLETIVSGPAIVRQATALLPSVPGAPALTTDAVFQAAHDGQPEARAVVNRVIAHLVRALQWLVMTYDVEKVVLGGGVTGSSDLFWDLLLAELARVRRQSNLAAVMLDPAKIELLPRDYNAGLWGAIRQARRFVDELPAGSSRAPVGKGGSARHDD